MDHRPPPPNLLVVDDTPANLQLLMGMLQNAGYRIRAVTSGERALRAVAAEPPDLILLDITMPEMDGYEVCRRLKADPATAGIPVLFISALTETEDRVRAFAAGGVDYVSKPIQLAEVLARVRTHLQLRQRELDLAASLRRQRELERLRDSLTHMLAHDMRTPLMVMRMTLDLLAESAHPEDREAVQHGKVSVRALIGMINDMLDVSRFESAALVPKREPLDLSALAREVVADTRLLATELTVTVEASHPVTVAADRALVLRVIANLVGNAYKFAARAGQVVLRVSATAEAARFEVTDDGRGIAAQDQPRIFEKFGQVLGDRTQYGNGLGLTFAKLAVEAHGGAIGVTSALDAGSTFWFTLPYTAPTA